jgi:RNA polymerase sigma factor (sigma-70 family)
MTTTTRLDELGNDGRQESVRHDPAAAVGAKSRIKTEELSSLDSAIDQAVTREDELRWAYDLRDARDALVGLFEELPPAAHRFVTNDLPDSATDRGHDRWSLEWVEACYERFVAYADSYDDTEVTVRREHAAELKRSLDQARESLVVSNLYIVPHIVKRFRRGLIPFVDLVQEGHVGLIKAVDQFDPDRGYRFSTYAYWWIRRALSDAFTNRSRLIRLPESLREGLREMRRTKKRLEEELGRMPTARELAEQMETSEKKVRKLLDVVPDPGSIEELAQGYDEGWSAIVGEDDSPGPLDRALTEELRKATDVALEQLEPREREVIRLRYGFDHGNGLTLAEIGKAIGLSRERVRQIERGALGKLHAWASQLREGVC